MGDASGQSGCRDIAVRGRPNDERMVPVETFAEVFEETRITSGSALAFLAAPRITLMMRKGNPSSEREH